jgi:predicted metal-binding transcription factor (methanogenesis marker protein 9)
LVVEECPVHPAIDGSRQVNVAVSDGVRPRTAGGIRLKSLHGRCRVNTAEVHTQVFGRNRAPFRTTLVVKECPVHPAIDGFRQVYVAVSDGVRPRTAGGIRLKSLHGLCRVNMAEVHTRVFGRNRAPSWTILLVKECPVHPAIDGSRQVNVAVSDGVRPRTAGGIRLKSLHGLCRVNTAEVHTQVFGRNRAPCRTTLVVKECPVHPAIDGSRQVNVAVSDGVRPRTAGGIRLTSSTEPPGEYG